MARYLVLRISRENSPIKLPDGGSVPALTVSFNPIIDVGGKTRITIEASDAETALAQAKNMLPRFSSHLAVQDVTEYDYPSDDPIRILRATKARSD